MSKTSLKALQAKVKAAQKANAAKIVEAALEASLKATLKLESSEVLFKSKVKLAIVSQHTKTLQDLVNECSAIVDTMPVHNKNTGTDRKWSSVYRFAFGSQINLMYQLAAGIMYSCAEHKQLLLAHTKLNSELLEQFVEAFGAPAYYSRNVNKIIEAKPYTIDDVIATVNVMQSELGVVVDTKLLTTEEFSLEFGKGEITAQTNLLAAEEAIAKAGFEL